MPSIREKENKKVGEEILDLLSKPTAKERSLAERFRSQGGENKFLLHKINFDIN
jgi:mRNA (2'-O-methyladenosine-N6-)-methyltransferase